MIELYKVLTSVELPYLPSAACRALLIFCDRCDLCKAIPWWPIRSMCIQNYLHGCTTIFSNDWTEIRKNLKPRMHWSRSETISFLLLGAKQLRIYLSIVRRRHPSGSKFKVVALDSLISSYLILQWMHDLCMKSLGSFLAYLAVHHCITLEQIPLSPKTTNENIVFVQLNKRCLKELGSITKEKLTGRKALNKTLTCTIVAITTVSWLAGTVKWSLGVNAGSICTAIMSFGFTLVYV